MTFKSRILGSLIVAAATTLNASDGVSPELRVDEPLRPAQSAAGQTVPTETEPVPTAPNAAAQDPAGAEPAGSEPAGLDPVLPEPAVAEPVVVGEEPRVLAEPPRRHSPGQIPPGTLGRTYYRRSHPVPADKHPRTAMLAVRDHGCIPVLSVRDMGGFRMKSGVWLLESERPLDPGVSHVVRVEARRSAQEIEPYDCRFVRLIPGRIVYLDF